MTTSTQDLFARLVAERDAVAPPMPPKVILHSNRENQDRYTTRSHPRMAKALQDAAHSAGWSVQVGWSLVAIPEGFRASNRSKPATVAYLLEVLGVYVASTHAKAWAVWHVPGPGAPKSAGGAQGGQLLLQGRTLDMGVEALIGYIRGEVDL